MELPELNARLLEDARRYDPAVHVRTLLGPHREALFTYRVKFMSYEQIAATLLRNGLKVSSAAVGVFCRRNFTKGEILRERRRVEAETRRAATSPAGTAQPTSATSSVPGKRGPKIARDDY